MPEVRNVGNNIEIAENDQKRPILITKGYSRDHRPDLKQCVLDLIVTGLTQCHHIYCIFDNKFRYLYYK